MTDLTRLAENVLDEIYQTPEYTEFKRTLSELQKDETLYTRVNEFREKNFMLQQSGADDLLNMLDALTNEYEDVINIELVSEFFSAEVAFCRLVQDFNQKVFDGLNFG